MAPIAIYVIKRKDSRFVALHAIQAALVQVLFGAVTVVASVVAVFVSALGMFLARSEGLAMLVTMLPLLAFAFGCLTLLTLHLIAAYRAWRGDAWQIPVVGSLARAIMGADEGAARA